MDFEKPYRFGSAVSIDVVFIIFSPRSLITRSCPVKSGDFKKQCENFTLTLRTSRGCYTLERTAFVKRKADRIYLTF